VHRLSHATQDRLNKSKKGKGSNAKSGNGADHEDLTEARVPQCTHRPSSAARSSRAFAHSSIQEQVLALVLWCKVALAEASLFESILKFKMQKQVKGACVRCVRQSECALD
jgi:hypothetical protein